MNPYLSLCLEGEWAEGKSISWGISAVVYCSFSTVSIQAISQKTFGRIHLHTSMFLTQHFSHMISFTCKCSVLSSWHKKYLYFVMYIYLITTCFNLCRSSPVNVHFESKGCSPMRSSSLVGALAVLHSSISQILSSSQQKVGQHMQLGLHTGCSCSGFVAEV